MFNDFRYAFRQLRKSPGFTTVAVITLALGIGANSAVFSLIDALGFRPPPVREIDRLNVVQGRTGERRERKWAYLDYRELREQTTAFSSLAAYGNRGVSVTAGSAPELTILGVVSANYFSTLGVDAIRGRVFLEEEDRVGGAPSVAMISARLWQQRFGGQYEAGQTIDLNGQRWTVAGVLPAGFSGLEPHVAPDVWITTAGWARLTSDSELHDRGFQWLSVVGRTQSSVSIDQAQLEMSILAHRLAENAPEHGRDRDATVMSLMEARSGNVSGLRWLLLALAALVLLIACANVAGLLASRAEARRREFGIRAAIGAGRARLFRQLIVESLMLAILSAGAAVVLAAGTLKLLPSLLPPSPVPLGFQFPLDARVVLFTLGTSIATIAFFGLLPAVIASRSDVLLLLRGDGGGGRCKRLALRHLLVAGQFAASLVLVAAAGLLAQSLWRLARVDVGFARRPMVIVTVAPGVAGYERDRLAAFTHDLIGHIAVLPGVERATAAWRMPLSPFGGGAAERVIVPGSEPPPGQDAWTIKFTGVAPDYFATVGTRLLRGREFAETDGEPATRVAVVSRTMAERFWPGGDPIGRHIRVGRQQVDHEIVGVVDDVKINSLQEPLEPYFYVCLYQRPSGDLTLIAQTTGDERDVAPAVRAAIRRTEPRLPMVQMVTSDEHMRLATFEPRILAILAAVLGSIGLLLAVVGLYGVVSYLVSRRAREIGVRLALGAEPADVLRDVLRRGLAIAVAGVGVGLVVALLVGRILAGTIYGVSSTDPLTLTFSTVVLCAVALVATFVPARRASRVDPMTVLRTE